MPPSTPVRVQVARNAMATRFEVVLHGKDPVSLRAAGEEALDEIERLESKLSLYRPDSEIARVNSRAAREPVRVSADLFQLLQHARRLHDETEGACDITVGPLMRAWGFMAEAGHLPDPEELAMARSSVGMQLLQLDTEHHCVRFSKPGVMLDLGAVGKGYAIEKAAEILREAGVESALIHGGTSTVCGLGAPPGEDAWKVAIESPPQKTTHASGSVIAIVPLRDNALSVSAVWGKSFLDSNITYGHVIDPRTGKPAQRALLAAVSTTSATESDALSTALLTLGSGGEKLIGSLRSDIRTLVLQRTENVNSLSAQGMEVNLRKV